jgi:tetratricopeptide (TPR) repeat protein
MERSVRASLSIVVITFAVGVSSSAFGEESSGAADLDRGRLAYLEADFEGAAEAFEAVISQENVNEAHAVEAHRYLAALELIFENPREARGHVEAAIAIDPSASPPGGAPPELNGLFNDVRSQPQEDQTEPEPDPEPEPEGPGFTSRWVTLGVGAGVYVPTIVNDMLPHVTASIDLGLLLPFHDRRLSFVFGAAYSPPGNSGEGDDPRIGQDGGDWSFEARTHEVFLSLGLVYRFLPPGVGRIWPYFGALARFYLLTTTVDGEAAGAEFGENTEVSSQFGGVFVLGAEVRLGPGGFYFDLAFGISDLPHRITGDTSTGALALNVGYRFFI